MYSKKTFLVSGLSIFLLRGSEINKVNLPRKIGLNILMYMVWNPTVAKTEKKIINMIFFLSLNSLINLSKDISLLSLKSLILFSEIILFM